MIISDKTAQEKRKDFRAALNSGKLLQFPGAYNPMVGMLIEQKGFDGVYVSGAVMANSLGLPDIGMTTLPEVSQFASAIARVTSLPSIMDIDTGFGETMSVARTIKELTYLGMAGCHIEDQINPKRCGHLDNKELVTVDAMVQKVKAAAEAKTDENFVVIARTDARGVEGLDKALDRAKAYVDAGADMNAQDRNGRTCLHLACLDGNPDAITHLITAGADQTITDNRDWTAKDVVVATTKP